MIKLKIISLIELKVVLKNFLILLGKNFLNLIEVFLIQLNINLKNYI